MTLEARTPMTEKRKPFVRWSTPESREAGQVSILAIAETILALALYWGIAIVFDTRLHLVTSLLVEPLLLLRSEHSIEAGVAWFRWDWFDSRTREGVLPGILVVLGLAVGWWVSDQLAQVWLADQTGWELFLSAVRLAVIGILLSTMVGVAVAIAGIVAVTGAMAVVGVGSAIRAIVIRLVATLRFLLFDGIRSLPEN